MLLLQISIIITIVLNLTLAVQSSITKKWFCFLLFFLIFNFLLNIFLQQENQTLVSHMLLTAFLPYITLVWGDLVSTRITVWIISHKAGSGSLYFFQANNMFTHISLSPFSRLPLSSLLPFCHVCRSICYILLPRMMWGKSRMMTHS